MNPVIWRVLLGYRHWVLARCFNITFGPLSLYDLLLLQLVLYYFKTARWLVLLQLFLYLKALRWINYHYSVIVITIPQTCMNYIGPPASPVATCSRWCWGPDLWCTIGKLIRLRTQLTMLEPSLDSLLCWPSGDQLQKNDPKPVEVCWVLCEVFAVCFRETEEKFTQLCNHESTQWY